VQLRVRGSMRGLCDENPVEKRKSRHARCDLTLWVLRCSKKFMIVSCDAMSTCTCLCTVPGFRQEGFLGLPRIVQCLPLSRLS
jgi:hypothetical protein